MKEKKQTLALIGMGMMGGSLGLAVKRRKLSYRVIGVGRNPLKLARAQSLRACDAISTDYSALKEADIVVVCTSVSQIVPQIEKAIPHLKSGAIVTDIGSVKSSIVEEVRALQSRQSNSSFGKFFFIGSHPLAGSEKTGVENADPNLYKGATVVLSPLVHTSKILNSLKRLWTSVGAKPLILEPPVHDLIVAQTSHLPHVLAGAFVQVVATMDKKDANTGKLLAGSFRDFTRIADSDPVQWAEICFSNQNFVMGALKSYRDVLTRLINQVQDNPKSFSVWNQFFNAGKSGRTQVLKK